MDVSQCRSSDFFSYAGLRRLAEEVGILSIDRTQDGVAFKFSEKARVLPEKLAIFVNGHEGSVFTLRPAFCGCN